MTPLPGGDAPDVHTSPMTTSAVPRLRPRRTRIAFACAAAVIAAGSIGACSSSDRKDASAGRESNAAAVGGQLNPASVDLIADRVEKDGLAMPNRRNVTSTECPKIGCSGKVASDTVSITKFPTTGKAEIYYSKTDPGTGFQIGNVVAGFASSLSDDQRQSYEGAITQASR